MNSFDSIINLIEVLVAFATIFSLGFGICYWSFKVKDLKPLMKIHQDFHDGKISKQEMVEKIIDIYPNN